MLRSTTPASTSHRLRRVAVGLSLAATAAVPAFVAAPARAEIVTLAPADVAVRVQSRGNGHGHGMSQYGARGAALAGRTYRQIVAFYYPGTRLATVADRVLRVKLSGFGPTTTVSADPYLVVTGVRGLLPYRGLRLYRLVAAGAVGLTLQRLAAGPGSTWTTVRTHLADGAEFHRADGFPTRLCAPDGSSTLYYGTLRAVRRSGGGVFTVNRVGLDRYTAGVVPREMPAAWSAQAVYAQAVAARTYALYEMLHSGRAAYDICATSMCQVYGGHAHYDRTHRLAWTDFPEAARATAHQVLTYRGAPILAQFSASNGGWTVAGGLRYLMARVDPYDNAASGDPYLLRTTTVSRASIARYFGLKTLTRIAVAHRDGHGAWGGHVVVDASRRAGYVVGRDAAGVTRVVPVSVSRFEDVFGLGTTWFTVSRG
ncbi:MAG TPA: SpoIID/LytB domain-containing protein [Jatrophihabitans sp.]|jgi:peptidoglycan hydrolase-like amidase|uniref:SpoIID/LytB domain-containing protein n=1 Tax=Jatrophihabitans sp. TaxID=1932789 RepID=UPI002E049D47|nr:SpoIID/LytB domain-containing protein [Jatrophihabitans sp.]